MVLVLAFVVMGCGSSAPEDTGDGAADTTALDSTPAADEPSADEVVNSLDSELTDEPDDVEIGEMY